MFVQAMSWFLSNWMEFASLLIAIAALLYAAFAHSSAKRAARAAEFSDNTNFKVQVNSALGEAENELGRLRMNHQGKQRAWEVYERKHLPPLGRSRPNELRLNDDVIRQGSMILSNVQQCLVKNDDLSTEQLADLILKAKSASVKLQALNGNLEGPPSWFD